MYFSDNRRLAAYEVMMRQIPGSGRKIAEDACCYGCKNHRPKWKYRYCVLLECPYAKGMTTFRENPREEE